MAPGPSRTQRYKKARGYLIALISLTFLAAYFYGALKGMITAYLLKSRAVFIKAVVIDSKNYNPNSDIPDGFSYSYRFFINSVPYEGNALDKTLRIDDSVEVEYVRGLPSLNHAVHAKEW